MWKPVGEVAGIPVDVAEVGGSTGGRLEDLRELAHFLKDRHIHAGVRLQVVPATRGVFRNALREGLIEMLIHAAEGYDLSPSQRGL